MRSTESESNTSTTSGPERVVVSMDSRGRVSLGAIVKERSHYLVTVDDAGRIILEPAVVVAASSVAQHQD